jgi:hypothetical protein
MSVREPVDDAAQPRGRAAQRVEKEQFWRRQIEVQAASWLSANEWCLREQLSEPSFYAWRRKVTQGDRESSESVPTAASSGFLPIRLPAASNVELQLPSSLVIGVPAQETGDHHA